MRPDVKNTGKDERMPHERTPMAMRIHCLCNQGYDKEFMLMDEGLKCLQTGELFQPDDIRIIEHQRFEGISDPDDMAILYVIETNTGAKGLIIDAFGIYANKDLISFMNEVQDDTVENITQTLDV
jgi:hypothetical protein